MVKESGYYAKATIEGWYLKIFHIEGGEDLPSDLQDTIKQLANPSKELLKNLVVTLRSRPITWLKSFLDAHGLSLMLEKLENTSK